MKSEQAKTSQTIYKGDTRTTFKNHGEDEVFIFEGILKIHNAVLFRGQKANRVSICKLPFYLNAYHLLQKKTNAYHHTNERKIV